MLDPQLNFLFIAVIIFGIYIFFIPARIAFHRKIKSRRIIFLLTLFFVLSIFFSVFLGHLLSTLFYIARIIFWFVALIWACVEKKEEKNLNIEGGEK